MVRGSNGRGTTPIVEEVTEATANGQYVNTSYYPSSAHVDPNASHTLSRNTRDASYSSVPKHEAGRHPCPTVIPFIPPKSVVGQYAAKGNPVRIRRREEMTPAGGGRSGNSSTTPSQDPCVDETLLNPSSPPPLLLLMPPSCSSSSPSPPTPSMTSLVLRPGAVRQLLTTGSLVPRTNVHATFWVPNPCRGEVGLLELIHRRGHGQRQHILLQSRPIEELKRNFSPANSSDYSIDLSHSAFRLSKTALAVAQMSVALGGERGPTLSYPTAARNGPMIQVHPEDLQAAVVQNLQSMQEDEYYLVRYRDYSPWAVQHYPDLVRSASGFWESYMSRGGGKGNYNGVSIGGRGFVEQCFAVHVGREAGELIPITEAQLLYGQELIDRQLAQEIATTPSASTLQVYGRDPNAEEGSQLEYIQRVAQYRALGEAHFHSMWAILGEGFIRVGLEGDERQRRIEAAQQEKDKYFREFAEETDFGGAGGGLFYKAPAWYDWRPSAIQKRVHHQLQRTYHSVGKVAFQVGLISLFLYFAYRSIPGVPSLLSGAQQVLSGGKNEARGAGNLGSADGRYPRYGVRRGFFGSLFMGPKDLADYFLAPLGEER